MKAASKAALGAGRSGETGHVLTGEFEGMPPNVL